MAKQADKQISLYNGKVTIGFWESQHRYSKIINGEAERTWITSVTGATGVIDKSRVLITWAIRLTKDYLMGNMDLLKKSKEDVQIRGIVENACIQHTMVKEEAASIGSLVHKWCEDYIKATESKTDIPEMPTEERALNGVTAFLRWIRDNKVKFIASEKLVYSKKHDYVGLMDLKAKVNGKMTLVDFKTSSGVYPEYFLQVAAYRAADEEESGEKYDDSIILHFDKEDGELEVHKAEDHKRDYEIFLHCLAIKKWQKETGR